MKKRPSKKAKIFFSKTLGVSVAKRMATKQKIVIRIPTLKQMSQLSKIVKDLRKSIKQKSALPIPWF